MAKIVISQIGFYLLFWLDKGDYEYWMLKNNSGDIEKLLQYKLVSVDDKTKGEKAVYSITELGRKVLAMRHPGKAAMEKAKNDTRCV